MPLMKKKNKLKLLDSKKRPPLLPKNLDSKKKPLLPKNLESKQRPMKQPTTRLYPKLLSGCKKSLNKKLIIVLTTKLI